VAAFWFGFRHGIDWDHIAAITDITSSQEERRTGVVFATLYALGHALVVLALGILAVVAGDRLPSNVDAIMGRVVGVTLLVLGVYVLASLVKHGRDFRLRSRWMLVFAGVRKGARWVRDRVGGGHRGSDSTPANEHVSDEIEGESVSAHDWHHGHHGQPGHHHHAAPERDDLFQNYTRMTSFGVGMIHGVGAETPTQVLIFLTAAGAGGRTAGIAVLLAFIIGLLGSNSLIAVGSAWGFLRASTNFPLYATVAVLTAVFSLVLGTLFVLGKESVLPAIFGG
jgi:cytochrome c biogenesis protein CcdA